MDNVDDLISYKEASRQTNLTYWQLKTKIKYGEIVSIKLPSGISAISQNSVTEFMDKTIKNTAHNAMPIKSKHGYVHYHLTIPEPLFKAWKEYWKQEDISSWVVDKMQLSLSFEEWNEYMGKLTGSKFE